jgi:uncharacterized protein with PIN domain
MSDLTDFVEDHQRCSKCNGELKFDRCGEDEWGPYTAFICPVCSPNGDTAKAREITMSEAVH